MAKGSQGVPIVLGWHAACTFWGNSSHCRGNMSYVIATTKRISPLVVAAGLTAFATTSAAQIADISDGDIVRAIEQEFLRDDIVPFNRIDVVSENGVVTLTGRVSNLAARRHAEDVVGIVRGVRSIVDRVEVATEPRTVAELGKAVEAALAADPTTEPYGIEVWPMAAGLVQLTGTVDSWAERMLTENVVATVPGVTAIDNRIGLDNSAAYRREADISNDITGRMRWDVRVDDSLIHVLVREGGRVLLSGTVGSLAEKQHAIRLAWVDGVHEVDAESLNVESWARDADVRRDEAAPIAVEDEAVETALSRSLRYDPRVRREGIDIAIEGGTALLRGSVDNLQAKVSAERDALNTVGVERVFNHLKVHPMPMLSDTEIEQLLTDTLSGYGLSEASGIGIDVHEGVARLTGDVDTMLEYWRADQAASAVRGVEALHNDITVRGSTPTYASYWYGFYPRLLEMEGTEHSSAKSDREIYADVESELFWSPFVDEDSVDIDVDDGLVILSGRVDSDFERRAARDNAFEGGARVVQNDLVVVE